MSAVNDETRARYRKRAEELRALAARETDPVIRAKLLKAADACEELAERQSSQTERAMRSR
jgi:hypothetical protein